ncbi:MAG: exopolygalacturonase [Clostridia bacterium]|nr:exopolygalacturonase [Clostridia bacterium]
MSQMQKEYFPDGTLVGEWFYQIKTPSLKELGKPYVITDYGVKPDGKVYTKAMQDLIDRIFADGGGVLVVPSGTFYTGALFFKQGVNLYVEENGTLKGSDDISDYPVCDTRIEGESCKYYPALINADGVDGFTMCGKGVIDGNGERFWKAFWKRREWNPDCTNKDEQRPRLVFISNSKNCVVADLKLQNSPFWTNHIYKCNRVKFLNCHIFAPKSPVPAPSSDAIDIDACTDVLVKNCYMEVNDDSVVLKGGKGPWADESPENGANERIIVEDCRYGFCHSGLTCGSESILNRNVIVRRLTVDGIAQLIHFKLRPDTPQRYEYISVEGVTGKILHSFINVNPWTQFFDLKGRTDKPISIVENITIKDCQCSCGTFFNVSKDVKQYELKNFALQNLQIEATVFGNDFAVVDGIKTEKVNVKTL